MLDTVTEQNTYLKQLNKISYNGVSCLRVLQPYRDRYGNIIYDKNGKPKIYSPFVRYRNDISNLLKFVDRPTNYFLPINGFTKAYDKRGHWGYRADKDHLHYLRGVWLDLDLKLWKPEVKKLQFNRKIKRNFYFNILPRLMKEAGLLTPTAIDDSGYGFHILYIFTRQIALNTRDDSTFTEPWHKTINTMVNRFNKASKNELGVAIADNETKSICKLFRLTGSFNCKYNQQVLCETVKFNGVYYSMWQLYRKYVQKQPKAINNKYRRRAKSARQKYIAKGKKFARIKHKHYIEKGIKWHKENEAKKQASERYNKAVVDNAPVIYKNYHTGLKYHRKSRYTLYTGRMKDIRKIIKLRQGQMFNQYKYIMSNRKEKQECAEFALFLYAVNYVHLKHDKHLANSGEPYDLGKALHLLNSKIAPKWQLDDEKINKIVTESQNKYFMDYGYIDSNNYLNRDWYIAALGLTEKEMHSMKTLINHKIKSERKKIRHKAEDKAREPAKARQQRMKNQTISKVAGAKSKRYQRKQSAIKLKKQGLSVRKIAKRLKIGKSTVSRYLQ